MKRTATAAQLSVDTHPFDALLIMAKAKGTIPSKNTSSSNESKDSTEATKAKKPKVDKAVVKMKTIMLYYWKKSLENKTPNVFPHISNVFRDEAQVDPNESHGPLYWLGLVQQTLASMMERRGYKQQPLSSSDPVYESAAAFQERHRRQFYKRLSKMPGRLWEIPLLNELRRGMTSVWVPTAAARPDHIGPCAIVLLDIPNPTQADLRRVLDNLKQLRTKTETTIHHIILVIPGCFGEYFSPSDKFATAVRRFNSRNVWPTHTPELRWDSPRNLSSTLHIEVFFEHELYLDITRLAFFPKYTLLDPQIVPLIRKHKHILHDRQAPRLLDTGMVARFFGFRVGDWIHVLMPCPTGGRRYKYRLVSRDVGGLTRSMMKNVKLKRLAVSG